MFAFLEKINIQLFVDTFKTKDSCLFTFLKQMTAVFLYFLNGLFTSVYHDLAVFHIFAKNDSCLLTCQLFVYNACKLDMGHVLYFGSQMFLELELKGIKDLYKIWYKAKLSDVLH